MDGGREDPGELQPLQRRAGGGDRHLPVSRLRRGRRRAGTCARPWISWLRVFPTISSYAQFLRRHRVRHLYHRRSGPRPGGSDRAENDLSCCLFLGKFPHHAPLHWSAVAVSIVGTFAVLLAAGYTANTVSLLALVLAIGIVVDDAIVVVENVERVIEEEPDLSEVEDAARRRCAKSPARLSRSRAGAAVGVRAGGVHCRHRRPVVPATRRRGLAVNSQSGR